MKRTHHSSVHIHEVHSVDQSVHPSMKPNGFWYGVDGDWERWCQSEEFGDIDNEILHVVELGNERVLNIRSCKELDAFNTKWTADGYFIDWGPLAELYDGIEIAPYLWKRRFQPGMTWYYAWDCASGCIWRPKGITVTATNNDYERKPTITQGAK